MTPVPVDHVTKNTFHYIHRDVLPALSTDLFHSPLHLQIPDYLQAISP